jgi:hypothetical protein
LRTGIIILSLFLTTLIHAAPCGIHGTASRKSQEYTLNVFKNRSQAPSAINPHITLEKLARGARYDNAAAAAIVGYIALVKPGDAETCNCKAKDAAHKDTHIALVTDLANANDESKYVIEERGKLNKTGPDGDGFSFFPIHGSSFLFPATLILELRGSGRGEEPSGGNVLRLIQIRLTTSSFEKKIAVCQANSQPRIADWSSINAVSFSSFARWNRQLQHSPNSIRLC